MHSMGACGVVLKSKLWDADFQMDMEFKEGLVNSRPQKGNHQMQGEWSITNS